MDRETYISTVKKASGDVSKLLLKKITFEMQDDKWWRETMDEFSAIVNSYKDTPARNFASEYAVMCIDELEWIQCGMKKRNRDFIYRGRIGMDEVVDYIKSEIGDKKARVSKMDGCITVKAVD